MRINRPCPKVATAWRHRDPPITWRYKDFHYKGLQVGSPKLGVQVSVVTKSQSISSWSRSPIAGGGASPRKQPSDCAANTGFEVLSHRFPSHAGGRTEAHVQRSGGLSSPFP